MIVGFTGTQKGMTSLQKVKVLEFLTMIQPTEARHGDCIGSDEDFDRLIRNNFPSCNIFIHAPTIDTKRAFCRGPLTTVLPPKSYLVRNRNIVNNCVVLFACPKTVEEELGSGTWSTIRYAKAIGRRLVVVNPI